MANYIDGDEFLYDVFNDLPLEFIPEQSPFLNAKVDDVEMLSETTSLNFSDSGFAKPRSRPKWYDEFFQSVSKKRHKCKQCGWIGMAAKHSPSNLIRHFQSEKSKGCKAKYEDWKKEIEKLQSKLPSVLKGEISYDKLNKETQTHLDTLLDNFIVFSEVPLRLVENEEFRDFCKGLNPKYRVPYRRKLKDSILKPMLEDSQKELCERLHQSEFVSLTIDGWSSRRLLSMLGVIVNFTNVNGN